VVSNSNAPRRGDPGLAAALLGLAACAAPGAAPPGGAGATVETGRSEPERISFDGPKNAPGREELAARFFEARAVAFGARAEAEWVALGSEPAVLLTVRNSGTKALRLVGERTRGVWPFSSTERGRIVLHVAVTWAARAGVRSTRDAVPAGPLEDLVIAPGSERALRFPLPLALPAGTECARVVVRPLLHPLAVEVEDEPERVVALRFPDVTVMLGPAEVALAAAADGAPLARALEERPEQVVAAAVRLAEHDPVAAVDRLLAALPGPDARARRARCVALEWITSRRLGDSVERWRGWWDSEEGMRFAGDRRNRP